MALPTNIVAGDPGHIGHHNQIHTRVGGDQVTGALQAARFVGGTVAGAPVAGTFMVGDFVIDQTGHVWVCTVAGTPGTWFDASTSDRELAYAESLVLQDVTSTTPVDVTGLSITFDPGTLPYIVEFHVPWIAAQAGAPVAIVGSITDGSDNIQVEGKSSMTAANEGLTFTIKRRFAASPGAKTYKARAFVEAGDTVRLVAVTGLAPFFIIAYHV